jgi:SAM-dependent methyltransferase
MNDLKHRLEELRLARWPTDELELLGRCPACGDPRRHVRFSDLSDDSFAVAPGKWVLYGCDGCTAAYLDPRPSEQSIGRAYARYYTHDAGEGSTEPLYFWTRSDLPSRLKTHYLNTQHGYDFPGSHWLGHGLISRMASKRTALDFQIRHLPSPKGRAQSLLDVGCGNGAFVATATALGFLATGIDPDPRALENGRRRGLDIRTGILPDPSLSASSFDHVTLSHVLEHLHRPREALDQCLSLLRPGGRLWLSQPNLGAIGLENFGRSWRGLEAPRHLTLFSFASLKQLLTSIGFADIRLLESEGAASFYFRQSLAMQAGVDPYATNTDALWTPAARTAAAVANKESRADPLRGESLTVTAFRPS